ncbi:MAG: GtrA family protein [Devosia sp.]|nr:GtrA family protein [Devosia sp.]
MQPHEPSGMLRLGRAIWGQRIVRFVFVGAFNTLVGYVLYSCCLLLGAAPGIALAIATVLGAVFNYFSTGRVVFRHVGINRLVHFLLAYLVIYLANLAALQTLIACGLPAYGAQALLLPVVAALSFLVFKSFVFRGTA